MQVGVQVVLLPGTPTLETLVRELVQEGQVLVEPLFLSMVPVVVEVVGTVALVVQAVRVVPVTATLVARVARAGQRMTARPR